MLDSMSDAIWREKTLVPFGMTTTPIEQILWTLLKRAPTGPSPAKTSAICDYHILFNLTCYV